MFAGGRSRRAYRVYAEDDFLGVENPDVKTGAAGDSTFDGITSYTAAPRGLRGPLGGRVGLALVALVAMAVSGLVVHTLRGGVGGGGEATRTSLAPSVATAMPPARHVPVRRGLPVGGAPGALRRSSDFSSALGGTPRDGHERLSHVAAERTDGRPRVDGLDRRLVRASATITDGGAEPLRNESSVTAVPEFGFER